MRSLIFIQQIVLKSQSCSSQVFERQLVLVNHINLIIRCQFWYPDRFRSCCLALELCKVVFTLHKWVSRSASDHKQPGANVTARALYLNINWATGRAGTCFCAWILKKKYKFICRGRVAAEERTKKATFTAIGLTSGTFLLNSLLSSTRCLWECSLSSCRPASSDATEFSSLYKHRQRKKTSNGERKQMRRERERARERQHFAEPANIHPVKLQSVHK